jgi:hypothetical protein
MLQNLLYICGKFAAREARDCKTLQQREVRLP